MRALRRDASGTRLDAASPAPEPGEGEALVRPLRMGVSSPDLAAARGALGFSGVLGHEFVGVVERIRSAREEHRRLEGKRVVGSINIVCGRCETCRRGLCAHCASRAVVGLHRRDGCFADAFTLPIANLAEVPKSVSDDAAVFAAPLAASLHASQMIRYEGKPYVTVLGDGPVGLLAAQVMSKQNASVRLLGKHPEKFGLCEKWGIKHRHISEVGRRQDQDVVVDCTGSPTGLEIAMHLVRPRGKIILKTAPAPIPAESLPPGPGVDLARAVVNELEILGARCGAVADAVALLAEGVVHTAGMITRRARLAGAEQALAAADAPGIVKVVMEP